MAGKPLVCAPLSSGKQNANDSKPVLTCRKSDFLPMDTLPTFRVAVNVRVVTGLRRELEKVQPATELRQLVHRERQLLLEPLQGKI